MSNVFPFELSNGDSQASKMSKYYSFHSKIYAATRWSFLFGRKSVIEQLRLPILAKSNFLEVGCGTGHHLSVLSKNHPNLDIIGIDVSKEMLSVAKNKFQNHPKVTLLEGEYGGESSVEISKKPNIVLFSYVLTMVNPNFEELILQAKMDLLPGGRVAVVDFCDTPFRFFRNWMLFNHVRMESQLLPVLNANFETLYFQRRKAYFGLWTYFVFIGKKK